MKYTTFACPGKIRRNHPKKSHGILFNGSTRDHEPFYIGIHGLDGPIQCEDPERITRINKNL
jgi:hypothetical protein